MTVSTLSEMECRAGKARRRLKVLFLCTGNACRSQLADAWCRRLWADRIESRSAGVAPHDFIDPRIVKVAVEAGLDVSGRRPKHVSELDGMDFDYVITLCNNARRTCPVFPENTKMLHVAFDAPPQLASACKTEEEALVHYRRVRDEIGAFIEGIYGYLD